LSLPKSGKPIRYCTTSKGLGCARSLTTSKLRLAKQALAISFATA
jgi:hypothetical protein